MKMAWNTIYMTLEHFLSVPFHCCSPNGPRARASAIYVNTGAIGRLPLLWLPFSPFEFDSFALFTASVRMGLHIENKPGHTGRRTFCVCFFPHSFQNENTYLSHRCDMFPFMTNTRCREQTRAIRLDGVFLLSAPLCSCACA